MNKELQEIETWEALRKKLKTSYTYNRDWEQAILLFNQRLNRKFFNPVGSIIKHQKQEGEGFAIMTVQCALIEALATFRTGKIFNYDSRRNKKAPKYEYWQSKEIFTAFLHTGNIFENNFWKYDTKRAKVVNDPFSASDFYDKVRCGLMHEARTKNEWHINTTKKNVNQETIFIEADGTKIKVFRTILHHRLKIYVAEYSEDLRKTGTGADSLRRLFARKLDHIFDFKADPGDYDWWKDA